jgi:hypothetical protein
MGYRCLHDDVPHSKTLGRLTSDGERLYWRMLAVTDTWGRLTGDLDKLRLVAIPSLAWDDERLHRVVAELVRGGAIDRYCTDDVWVIQVVNFDERQLVAKIKRAPSRFPARISSSLSPEDLNLSLPLLDGQHVELEACDLGLSAGDLRASDSGKPLHDQRSTRETEDREDRRESVLPTAEARNAANGLPVAQTISESLEPVGRFELSDHDVPRHLSAVVGEFAESPSAVVVEDLASVAATLRGADDGTVNVLESLRRRGLPPAAFAAALESLRERRSATGKPPVANEVRYVVGALKKMLSEGTYGQGAAA